MVDRRRSLSACAAYSGLIAAPGTPNACVTPSFSMIATAASAAVIRAIVALLVVDSARPESSVDELEQAGVVEAAVAARDQGGHELAHDRAERDHHAGLAGGGR